MTDYHLDPPDESDDPADRIYDALCDGDMDISDAADKTGMTNALDALCYEIAQALAKQARRDEGEDRAADRKDRLEECCA